MYTCQQCDNECIVRSNNVICLECGYEIPKDTADKTDLLEACEHALNALCKGGAMDETDIQAADKLRAAIAKATK
jgi:hypothetical protein